MKEHLHNHTLKTHTKPKQNGTGFCGAAAVNVGGGVGWGNQVDQGGRRMNNLTNAQLQCRGGDPSQASYTNVTKWETSLSKHETWEIVETKNVAIWHEWAQLSSDQLHSIPRRQRGPPTSLNNKIEKNNCYNIVVSQFGQDYGYLCFNTDKNNSSGQLSLKPMTIEDPTEYAFVACNIGDKFWRIRVANFKKSKTEKDCSKKRSNICIYNNWLAVDENNKIVAEFGSVQKSKVFKMDYLGTLHYKPQIINNLQHKKKPQLIKENNLANEDKIENENLPNQPKNERGMDVSVQFIGIADDEEKKGGTIKVIPNLNQMFDIDYGVEFKLKLLDFDENKIFSLNCFSNDDKLFLVEHKGNSVSWKPQSEFGKGKKQKGWVKLSSIVKKQFQGVKLKETPIFYKGNSLHKENDSIDEIKKLDCLNKTTIEQFWNVLKEDKYMAALYFTIKEAKVESKHHLKIRFKNETYDWYPSTTTDQKWDEEYEKLKKDICNHFDFDIKSLNESGKIEMMVNVANSDEDSKAGHEIIVVEDGDDIDAEWSDMIENGNNRTFIECVVSGVAKKEKVVRRVAKKETENRIDPEVYKLLRRLDELDTLSLELSKQCNSILNFGRSKNSDENILIVKECNSILDLGLSENWDEQVRFFCFFLISIFLFCYFFLLICKVSSPERKKRKQNSVTKYTV